MRLRAPIRLAMISATIGFCPTAFGHGNTRPRNYHELWWAWEFDPLVVVSLAISGWLYVRGVKRLWAATHVGSGLRKWHAASFALGWFAAFVALMSPLHAWGRSLFSAHMTQHEVLMLAAAPLLVLARPMVAFLWAFPAKQARSLVGFARRPWFERGWKLMSGPFAAWLIHLVALWIWHVPALFEATIDNDFIHALQHFSFLGSALLFWWAVFHGRQRVLGYGLAVISIFTTALHSGLLGAILTFSKQVWYPAYTNTTADWGLTPLEDQQLGGVIMWIPAGVVYLIAGLALFASWLERPGRSMKMTVKTASVISMFALFVGCRDKPRHVATVAGGDAERGRAAIVKFGCGACHKISGVPGAQGVAAPPLSGLVERNYIAGVIKNTPDNLVRWIQDPPGVDHKTAMPNLRVSEAEARDIAAYLYQAR